MVVEFGRSDAVLFERTRADMDKLIATITFL
jgi:hypothetical protein